MKALTDIDLQSESMTFCAGHFTLFSATKRESFHGHNYQVALRLTVAVGDQGVNFDCRLYEEKIHELCQHVSHTFLLPSKSPYLQVEETDEHYYAYFHDEKIPFLKRDVTLLPLANISIEELSRWFLDRLLDDQSQLRSHAIQQIRLKVCSDQSRCSSVCVEL